MNTTTNTERPKLKLNFGKKPLTLATSANPAVAGPAPKKVAVFEKPEANDIATTKVGKVGIKTEVSSGMATDAAKAKNTDAASNNVVASPEEIRQEKIKRHKQEYHSILTKLQSDYPECFSEDPKPLAIGIDLELKKILNGVLPNIQLGRFFHRYCGSFKYKEKLIEGAQRFNLDGSPATLVTKKEVPVIAHKPMFVKKPKNISNEIQPPQ